MKPLIIIITIWNVVTFVMMGIDKAKAKEGKRRISEKTLLASSFIMGAAGIALGALMFHHKTRKLKFQILVPVSLAVNIIMIYILINYLFVFI